MSDQVSGPVGWLLIMVCGLVYFSTIVMPWLLGESMPWYDWLVLLLFMMPVIYFALYLLTHDYSWWPTHAQDRVARIRELVDEPDCRNPPGGKP